MRVVDGDLLLPEGGANRVKQLAAPSASDDAATKLYVDAFKRTVKAVATSSVTASGTTTINGVSLGVGDRVLLTAQASTTGNGVWVVASGAWTRAADLAAGFDAAGVIYSVQQGTDGDSLWLCTSDTAVVGTDSLVWVRKDIDALTAVSGVTRTSNALSLSTISTKKILANVSGSNAAPTATDPNSITFEDLTSGAGSIGCKVAPEAYVAVSSLATAGNVNCDVTLSENGYYTFTATVLVKLATAGTYRKVGAVITGKRSGSPSATLTMEGTQVNLSLGSTTTGLTVTLSATSGNLRVNVANATGETVSGRVHVGWEREDLL